MNKNTIKQLTAYPKPTDSQRCRKFFKVELIKHTITSIYQKFLETGSVHDLSRAGRPPTITKDKVEEVKEILKMEPANSVRNVAQQANISKTQAHVIMRDIIWFKP
ncbi:unnamed protein product [Rotaria magnacalcarata]|uniref:Transposase n=1 Tax=Rotaria magnacalcarata TaxID=392030 RepID=A0A819D3F3_9BILA|nr:unnamed protein product [Rotaria magnacalcarata]